MARVSRKGRASALFCFLLVCHAVEAATASSRNWRIDVESIGCEGSLLEIDARIDYLGPKGPVEAPVNRLVDAQGRIYLPKSLVWKRGDKRLARWLSAGGITNVQVERIGDFEFKFDLGSASRPLRLEFGDIRAFALTGKAGCLQPAELAMPRTASLSKAAPVKDRVYRGAYPCLPRRTVEADHPPQLPRQLLLLGHGFLPAAREIDLPTGKAPAQPYVYNGADDLVAVENAARQAIAADFPEYRGERFFLFNWGTQKSRSGNDVYSIGIYDLRSCPRGK